MLEMLLMQAKHLLPCLCCICVRSAGSEASIHAQDSCVMAMARIWAGSTSNLISHFLIPFVCMPISAPAQLYRSDETIYPTFIYLQATLSRGQRPVLGIQQLWWQKAML